MDDVREDDGTNGAALGVICGEILKDLAGFETLLEEVDPPESGAMAEVRERVEDGAAEGGGSPDACWLACWWARALFGDQYFSA